MIPRVQALRQAGYCQRCEFMTRAEAQQYLGISESTAMRRLPFVRIAGTRRVLIARADVEHLRARLLAQKKSWVAMAAA